MAPAVDSRKNGDLQPCNFRALCSNRQILWQSSSLYSPWLWVPTADSFCLSVSHHVPDTLWNRSKACEAWTRSWVRFLPTPPGSQSSLIFCFFFVENSEGSLNSLIFAVFITTVHIMMRTPHPGRSAKLSIIELSQYFLFAEFFL